MKRILHIITLICYCLPFTFFVETCVGNDTKAAFNKQEMHQYRQEAITLEQQRKWRDSITALENNDSLRPQFSQAVIKDTITSDSARTTAATPTVATPSTPDSSLSNVCWWLYSVWQHIKMPTDNSLSGIGAIFEYKSVAGRIVIAFSLLLSFILLLNLQILRKSKRTIILYSTNILCLIIFLMVSLLSSVSLMWGFWVLLILLFVQLYRELMEKQSNQHNTEKSA